MRGGRSTRGAALALGIAAGLAWPALAGVTVYEEGEKRIEIGGRVQILYAAFRTDCAAGVGCVLEDSDLLGDSAYDEIVFRRLRPYIAGSLTEHWMAKIEFDFGESEGSDEVQVKDAYFSRSGLGGAKSALTIGNAKTQFSREFLTSSANLQLVERGFAGNHNFGVPDRALGVHWTARPFEEKLSYGVSVGAQHHDPAVNRMDFDTPVNRSADWNEGWLLATRADWHPLGYQKFTQADFDRGASRLTVGAGAFVWENDGDNETYTDATGTTTSTTAVDLARAEGLEVAAAYRGHGFSADAQWQEVDGETTDETFTGGIYLGGMTTLSKIGGVAGYMLPGERVEFVAGWDSQDADNYEDEWTVLSGGVNLYFDRHNLKLQLEYQQVQSFIGLAGQDHDVILGSTQFQF